jgi:hypothetical protein
MDVTLVQTAAPGFPPAAQAVLVRTYGQWTQSALREPAA